MGTFQRSGMAVHAIPDRPLLQLSRRNGRS